MDVKKEIMINGVGKLVMIFDVTFDAVVLVHRRCSIICGVTLRLFIDATWKMNCGK